MRQQRHHYACHRCFRLGYEFRKEALGRIPEGRSQAEQLELLQQITRDADERVRHAVRGDVK